MEGEADAQSNQWSVFKRLLTHLKPYKFLTLLALAFLLFQLSRGHLFVASFYRPLSLLGIKHKF
ncbi:MAG: hypothetical protein ACLT8V_04855 [Streptococcus salivarius]